jgi:omega-hydroxy-beta-dihydromenaquinone-9 sulfotransferase
MVAPGPFFVGGTGRSGTSRLTAVIGRHPAVFSLPEETRFIVDPGGLEDLSHDLTVAYTPYHGDDALRRFDHLMRETLTGRTSSAFRGWDLPSLIGAERYWSALARLQDQLIWYSFDEGIPADPRTGLRNPYEPATRRRVIPRFFPNRAELVALLRAFVQELFGGAAADHGKPTWCEKTPLNVLSAPFLWELFPEATIIHITRHPIGVVASHLHQPWAPGSLEDVIAWLAPIYQRWFGLRDSIDPSEPRLVEVRLEDLAADWSRERRRLFESLGLDDAETEAGFELAAVRHRDSQLSIDERAFVVRELGWAMERLGYDPEG